MGRLTSVGPRISTRVTPKLKTQKLTDPFYASKRYLEWREAVFALFGRRCVVKGCETPHDRVTADHVIERKDGGAELDPANGRPLCHRHHVIKTAAMRRRRAKAAQGGVGSDQNP